MSGNRTCKACNVEFNNDDHHKLHYKSEWHRHNLIRKVADLEGITEDLFRAKLKKNNKLDETPMLYTCGLCCKSYKSPKAHAQHVTSKSHLIRASLRQNPEIESAIIIRPLVQRIIADDDEEEEDADSLNYVNEVDDGCERAFDPTSCFMCDLKNRTLEACMAHMYKKHGLFIPDIEYLKDPKGLLTCLGLKVRRDFLCLYCNERRHSFSSLEVVRKHMEAKGHCKVHEKVEVKKFYDYSSRYKDKDVEQLVTVNNGENSIKLGRGGCELILKKTDDGRVCTKTLGCRKFLRYYRQSPRPRPCSAIVALASSRFNCMELSIMQSKTVKDMRLFNMHQSKIARSLGLPIMQSKKKVRVMTMRMWKQIRRFGKEAISIRDSFRNLKILGSLF